MAGLLTDDRVRDPDDLYQVLVEAHRDLSPAESRRVDACLVLLLANHVGDLDVVRDAARAARRTIVSAGIHGAPED